MPFIIANDLNIHYRIFRDGAEVHSIDPNQKTMIVLHGGPGLIDHQMEAPYWNFSKQIQIIFPDLRACGKTDDGDISKWSIDLCADDLYAFCKALKLENPLLAGVSTGGFVIMSCITKHPTLPGAIIFCNTEARKSPEARKKALLRKGAYEAAAAAEAFDKDPTNNEKAQIFFEKCAPYFSTASFQWIPPAKSNWDVWAKNSKEWAAIDYRENLKRYVQCPVLYLAGVDDPNHPIDSSIETANAIPKKYLYFHAIPGAGAPVYLDQPEIFNTLVSDFIEHYKAAI
jgi:proline iminopeptidase